MVDALHPVVGDNTVDSIILIAILGSLGFGSLFLSTALAITEEDLLTWKDIALRWQNDYHDLRMRSMSGLPSNLCKHCGLLHSSVEGAIAYHSGMAKHKRRDGYPSDAEAEQQLVDALKLARKR